MSGVIQKLIRPHFQEMVGYVSAGMESGKDETRVFMNANENHFVLPALKGMSFYPEPQPQKLLELMAEAYGVKPTQMLATRGADEALALLTKTFCEPHQDAIVIHGPTFGMYAVNANASPAKIINVPLIKGENGFSLDKAGIIKAALDKANQVKIVYLCSPNNPTGGAFPKEDLIEIIAALKDSAIIILDEAYAEFSAQGSLVEELKNYPNLIILRTLSKAYSLAGVRMGACLCHDESFITFLQQKIMETYPLPRPAIEAAMIALAPENKKQIQENIQKALAETKKLKTYFEKSPLVQTVYPTDANFILVQFTEGISAPMVAAYAAKHGFILRDFSGKAETANCLRISPALPDQNDRLMEVLDSYPMTAGQ